MVRAGDEGAPLVKAALLQIPHGDALEDNLARARAALEEAGRQGATLALLPEYWFAPLRQPPQDQAEAAPLLRQVLADASRDLGLVVGANVIERRHGRVRNVGLVYEGGRLALEQDKVHPMPREAAGGVVGGDALASANVAGIETGMLVCADILYPEAAQVLALQGARILLNPVMSPLRAVDDTLGARDSIFVARAYDAGAFVLKAGGFRPPVGDPPLGVAGRSLAAAPWGILAKAKGELVEEILLVDLDLARLDAFREDKRRFPERRPDAYTGLL